jgi:hypothetical protein
LSTTLDTGNATNLLIITRWLQEFGLIGQEKLTDFLKSTAYNQSRTHGFPLWSEFLAPWEADSTTRKQERSTIIKNFPTLIPLLFGVDTKELSIYGQPRLDPPSD